MEKDFKLGWGQPQQGNLNYRELQAGETLESLNGYSELVLNMLRQNLSPDADYGEAAIKALSDDVNAGRLRYNDDMKTKIANVYGAFLGTSIIRAYSGRWVETEEPNIGVLLPSTGTLTRIVFPITRVFKQIEQGEEFSIYSLFMSIPEFIRTDPRA